MNIYAATFQLRYNDPNQTHSVIPEVTGHSYLLVGAESMSEARQFLADKIGSDYAFLYPFDDDFVHRQIPTYDLHPVVGPWDRVGVDSTNVKS